MITPEEKQKLLDFVNSLEVEQLKPIVKTKISELQLIDRIHCKSQFEYLRILILMHLFGLKWSGIEDVLQNLHYEDVNIYSCISFHNGGIIKERYDKRLDYIPSTQITGV